MAGIFYLKKNKQAIKSMKLHCNVTPPRIGLAPPWYRYRKIIDAVPGINQFVVSHPL